MCSSNRPEPFTLQNPEASDCWGALGRAYEASGKLDPAIRAYERGLELLPPSSTSREDTAFRADCQLRIALTKARIGLVKDAVADLEALHTRFPTWAVGAAALGDALYSRALEVMMS